MADRRETQKNHNVHLYLRINSTNPFEYRKCLNFQNTLTKRYYAAGTWQNKLVTKSIILFSYHSLINSKVKGTLAIFFYNVMHLTKHYHSVKAKNRGAAPHCDCRDLTVGLTPLWSLMGKRQPGRGRINLSRHTMVTKSGVNDYWRCVLSSANI